MKIEGAQFGQIGLQGGDQPSHAEGRQGSWRGETLTVQKSAASLLADAAEEMTFAQAEREEEKDVTERKVRAPRGLDIPQIQEIMDYLELLGDGNDQEKLQELVSKLKDSGGRDAAGSARDAFGDPSRQFLALGYAVRHFQGEGADPELATGLAQALEEFHEDNAQAIWAGLNTAEAARDFAGGDADRADGFRECYRETVLGREALADTFNAVLQRFGGDDMPRTIGFLIRAAGDDLSARGPSTPAAELKAIMEDLYQLEVLATVLESCHEAAAGLARDFGVRGIPGETLATRLVGLTGERWVPADRFARLADDMGATDVEARISFLQRSRLILREMPLKVFADPETRDKLLGAAQEALDLAIENEE